MEAAGESQSGKEAVASVLYHRAQSSKLTYSQVCLKRKQFSCWNSGKDLAFVRIQARVSRNEADAIAWNRSMALARAMTNKTFKPTIQADHYHTRSVNPVWAKNMRKITVIGNHVFYRAQ